MIRLVFIKFFIILHIVSAILERELGDVTIITALGKIRGTYLTSRLGENFYAFRGIRYATPPIDNLRFKAPKPIELWHETFDATEDGPMCPQTILHESDMSEDCLRLNIYTKELPSKDKPNIRKPVIVYIHPGRFYSHSSQSRYMAGPEILMDQKIVLVTINYRLGALGFLSTGTPDAPGNAGLKDQVMALKWIRLHISRFGGNPNSITLMGYGAGAISVTLHLISPMSKDLFHKAIIMSGSSTSQWKIPQASQINLTLKQASLLNCTTDKISDMVKCLKKKHFTEFILTQPLLFEFGNHYPALIWKPILEPNLGKEMFLTRDPNAAFNNGFFMRIPIIAGVTKDEHATEAYAILRNKDIRQKLDDNFNKYAPICFLYEAASSRLKNISIELRKMYLGSGSLHPERSHEGLSDLFSDSLSRFSVHRLVHLAARRTRVYYYNFSYKGRYSHFYHPRDKPYGAVHYDDLVYLFNMPDISPMFNEDDPENLIIERMTRMWFTFASTGNPNKPNDEYLKNLRWRPFTSRQENYLDIGDSLVMKNHLYTDRYAIWDRLFPIKN